MADMDIIQAEDTRDLRSLLDLALGWYCGLLQYAHSLGNYALNKIIVIKVLASWWWGLRPDPNLVKIKKNIN